MKKKDTNFKVAVYAFLFLLVSVPLYLISAFSIGFYQKKQAKDLYKEVKNNKIVYSYSTYKEGVYPGAIVENIEDTVDLYNYYRNGGDVRNIMFVPLTDSLFLINYHQKDSSIIEVVGINRSCWGYIHGYIFKSTCHFIKPSAELIQKHEEHNMKMLRENYYVESRVQKKRNSNIYGIPCGDLFK